MTKNKLLLLLFLLNIVFADETSQVHIEPPHSFIGSAPVGGGVNIKYNLPSYIPKKIELMCFSYKSLSREIKEKRCVNRVYKPYEFSFNFQTNNDKNKNKQSLCISKKYKGTYLTIYCKKDYPLKAILY